MTLDNLKYALFLNNKELLKIIDALEESINSIVDTGLGDASDSIANLQSLIDDLEADVLTINDTTIVGINTDLTAVHEALGLINAELDGIDTSIGNINTAVSDNNTAANNAIQTINNNITNMQTTIGNQIALINECTDLIKTNATAHYENTVIHVTADDKTLWNSILASAKEYTQSLFNGVTNFAVNIVDILPLDPTPMVVYFIAATNGNSEDYYDEFMYINDKWELIGSTYVNLDPYVLKTKLDEMLLNYLTINSFDAAIANYSTTDQLNTRFANYTNTETLALNYSTKQQVDDKLLDYTKTADLALNFATKQQVTDEITNDLKAYTDTVTLELNYATKQQVNTNLQDYTKTDDLVLNYATKQLLTDSLVDYTKTEDLSLDYATKQQVTDAFLNYTNSNDLALNYVSNSELTDELLKYVTIQSFNDTIVDYAKTQDVNNAFLNYTTTETLELNYALKTDLHSHTNQDILNDLSTNIEGKLLYKGAEISTDAVTVSQEPGNAITQKTDGIFVPDKTQAITDINSSLTTVTTKQEHIDSELGIFFDTFVPGSADSLQGMEDTPVGHVISFMGTETPSHYLACDGTVYHILEYPVLAQHISDNFGSANYFGGDGTMTFAVPVLLSNLLGNNDPLVKYFIKYEPTFFVNINNVVEPTIIDINKEIMETLELLQEGMGVNQIVTDTLATLNSNEVVIAEPEMQLIISDTVNILNSNEAIVIDMEMQTAISEAIDVLNQ